MIMEKTSNDKFLFMDNVSAEKNDEILDADRSAWKVLIVDDSPEVHDLTKLVFRRFRFEGKSIEFISAYSGSESLELLRDSDGVALVLLDVVMENDHAGLDVAKAIREDLHNKLIRIILRTGQPGQAPEVQVAIDYDINDYKDKADLTSSRLISTVVTALRGYRDLCRLDTMNDVLEEKVKLRTAELEKSKEAAEEANNAKSLFLSNISHEIRTPLNAILGFAQLSLRSDKLPKENFDMIQAIEVAGIHLLEVINDVLDLSKIEAGEMKIENSDFILSKLLDDIAIMFEMRCNQKSLQWSLLKDYDEDIEVRGDQGKIRQVLINLLGNAVKFTAKGEVQLRIVLVENDEFLFEVKDTGSGISSYEQDLVFNMFHQVVDKMNATGTGLGLSISKRQVELMGGTLELDSQLGVGSQFRFSLKLPVASNKVLVEMASEEKVRCLTSGTNISALVVDDVEVNRIMLCGLLLDLGVDVVSATNGQEALDSLRKQMVDIVYMDIRMPIMNGDDAVRHIRSEFSDTNVICVAISAYSMAHEVEYYMSVGFNRYISKPFRFYEIYQTLTDFCDAEFEYEEGAGNNDKKSLDEQQDFGQLVLPELLHSELVAAVELNRMTKIRQLLDEIELISNGGGALSAYLSRLLDSYDTGSMIDVLKNIGYK